MKKKKKLNAENIHFQVEAILGSFGTHVRIHKGTGGKEKSL